MIAFELPVRTVNPLNGAQGITRRAMFAAAAVRKRHRQSARLATLAHWRQAGDPALPVPLVVTLTRVSSGRLDGDGLQAALKSVRDGIADALAVNDGSDRVRWQYEQAKGPRGLYLVRVSIGAAQ